MAGRCVDFGHGNEESGERTIQIVKVNGGVHVHDAVNDDVEGIGNEIIRLVGLKNATPKRPADLVQLRVRAWTLVDRGYEEARRAVAYVRWFHGDAEVIAPSLRTHGGRRKKREREMELGGSD